MQKVFNYFKFIVLLFILVFSFSFMVNAQGEIFNEVDDYNNLRMGNDYIVIVVNQNENSKGRFAIETTGGAPLKDSDDNKPLVYGRPNPWTSYSTLRINGENYIFGGNTERRAGKNGNYGEMVQGPTIDNNKIITTYKFNNVLVEQVLSIVKSSTTGLYDAVQIKYNVKNNGENEIDLGLRVMLDTMLGENDGAPMRMGEEAITTDKVFNKDQLANFWQAFDSISSPKVTSQGTLIGEGITVPDSVYFSDWGSLADGSWDFDFNPGEEFIRKDGYEIDSAVAMYWENDTLASGESKSYISNYGLGGITTVPGLLTLGVTAPSEFVIDRPEKSFPIVAYVENTSEIEAKNVKVNLDIAGDFNLEEKTKNLGNLNSGEIRQVIWNVGVDNLDRSIENNLIDFEVKVSAENTDSNNVKRSVNLVGPPILNTSVKVSDNLIVEKGKIKPNPFTISAKIENNGASSLYEGSTEIILPPGVTLASYEKSTKKLGNIKAGENLTVNWEVKSFKEVEGEFPFAVVTKALHDYTDTVKESVNLPALKPTLYFKINKEAKEGELITVDIVAENIDNIRKSDLRISYDEEKLKTITVYPGDIHVNNSEVVNWNQVEIGNNGIIKINNILPDNRNGNILASMQFRIKDGNEIPINWHQIFLEDYSGNTIKEVENLKGVYIDE